MLPSSPISDHSILRSRWLILRGMPPVPTLCVTIYGVNMKANRNQKQTQLVVAVPTGV
jgi:hypothetical protein